MTGGRRTKGFLYILSGLFCLLSGLTPWLLSSIQSLP